LAGPRTWTTKKWFDKAEVVPGIAKLHASRRHWIFECQDAGGAGRPSPGVTPVLLPLRIAVDLYLNAFKGLRASSEGEWRQAADGSPSEPSNLGLLPPAFRQEWKGRELDGHEGEDETVRWLKLPRSYSQVRPSISIIAWRTGTRRSLPAAAGSDNFSCQPSGSQGQGVYRETSGTATATRQHGVLR